MKQSAILIALFCLLLQQGYAQSEPPQKVYSIVKVEHPFHWYVEQYNLWTPALKNRPHHPDGWLSYYTAARMAKILAPNEDARSEWLKKMDEVVVSMKKAIPNTYEYYYIIAYHAADRQKKFEYASKAYKMDPNRPDAYDDLLTYYELHRQKDQAVQVSKKWKASGAISTSTMLWNYNMLASVTPNAILFTAGDMDTYPAWIMQYADGVRPDVQVINTSLILIKSYRDALFKEMGIPAYEGDAMESYSIITHIVKNRGERPIYVGLSANNRVGLDQDKLFNVGLAFRYDEDGNDHLSLLIKNFEQHLFLNHLIYAVYTDQFPDHIKDMNYAYVPGLMMLHKHYGLMEDDRQQERIKAMIMGIIKGGKQEKVVLKALEGQKKYALEYCQQPQ